MKRYLSTGPPVYFIVTDGLNLTEDTDQNLLCGGIHCDSYSITNQIYRASKTPNMYVLKKTQVVRFPPTYAEIIPFIFRTYINRPSTSWIDDYFDWSALPGCCTYFPSNGSYCPRDNEECKDCPIVHNKWKRPISQNFSGFLPHFLQDVPDHKCSKAGRAAYSDVKRIRLFLIILNHKISFARSLFLFRCF